ncbi:DUF2712 domain-containing protein [[Clostridium] innocuum]|nr:DUF2712 domain-containing protein [Erysipelotrichaceae bacterium]MCR0381107.1 DUF2712 domain-containing protein [[Clostridium] innocuum]MCR0412373.1 DUF2712 domain-containing protein [[Clostridium] innocuum]MCR0533760.1 DUF2712 domain-containing protein [[Clostridium] innocuum]MCR0537845.1 DUF2712 domain-containing protein [[Clostridium] innocuum]
MKNKKIITAALSAIVLGTVLMSSSVFAAKDHWGFGFEILGYQENSRSSPRHRGTSNYKTPWFVAMTSSGENGSGTFTNFWLEIRNGKNVSDYVSVKEGGGEYKREAYSDACKTDVYLTAENNNYNAERYDVSGIWDEEY